MSVKILKGDCRDVLRTLPAEHAQCVVTSPPYFGLRDYGIAGQIGREGTPEAFVSELVAVFSEVRRVLRADGTLWLNLGDSYASGGRATYRSGASQNKGQHVQNDMPRPVDAPGIKPKDLLGIPWMVAFALRADGWYLRQDIIWSKPNPMPESVTDRCTKAHEYLFLLSKSERYHYDANAIKEDSVTNDTRRPYGSPGANSLDPRGRQGNGEQRKSGDYGNGAGRNDGDRHPPGGWCEGTTRNKRSVWEVVAEPFKEAHFATFPPALIEPCIKAGCPTGGMVLDPFGGAGTTGMVADRLGRSATLIELNPKYAAMIERRIHADAGMFAEIAV